MSTWSEDYDGSSDKCFTYIVVFNAGDSKTGSRRKLYFYFHPSGVRAGEEVTQQDEKVRGFAAQLEKRVKAKEVAPAEEPASIVSIHRIYSLWSDGVTDYCASVLGVTEVGNG